jgi:hypothetical protein
MPVRTYETYPVSKQIKFDLIGKEFGYDASASDCSEMYKNFLVKHNEKFDVVFV